MGTFVRCPCCNRPIPANAADVGLAVTCPRTKRLVPVRALESDAPAPSPTARPEDDTSSNTKRPRRDSSSRRPECDNSESVNHGLWPFLLLGFMGALLAGLTSLGVWLVVAERAESTTQETASRPGPPESGPMGASPPPPSASPRAPAPAGKDGGASAAPVKPLVPLARPGVSEPPKSAEPKLAPPPRTAPTQPVPSASVARLGGYVRDLDAANAGTRLAAIEGLAALLTESDVQLRRKAISMLAMVGPDVEPVAGAVRQALTDEDEEVRVSARAILTRLDALAEARKKEDARRAIEAVAKGLSAKEPEERVRCLLKLQAFGTDAEAVGELVIEALQDKEGAVRSAAEAALDKISPKVSPHVVALVRGPKSERRAAIVALAELGLHARMAVPLLLQQHENTFLWGGGNPKAGRYFEDLFPLIRRIDPKHPLLAAAVLNGVAAPNPKREREVRDKRRAALAQLPNIEAKTAAKVEALVAALGDESTAVEVIKALESYGPDASPALPKLRQLKQHTTSAIRDAAIAALAKLE